jgi:hypothetical protein
MGIDALIWKRDATIWPHPYRNRKYLETSCLDMFQENLVVLIGVLMSHRTTRDNIETQCLAGLDSS